MSPVANTIVWRFGGSEVILTGEFDNWSASKKMVKKGTDFVAPQVLGEFKFIVDGIWRCSLDYATVFDKQGNVNNTLKRRKRILK